MNQLFILAVLAISGASCGPLTFTIGGDPQDQQLQRKTVIREGGFLGDRVAMIDVAGMLHTVRKPGVLGRGESPVGLLHETLQEAAHDSRVKAVILRLNTPGGTVAASDAMYREVRRFRTSTGKPVVAVLMGVAASGGYYLACAADTVIAYPTAVTGSIGVIVQTLSMKPALERLGIHAEAITSGRNKDAGSFLSTLTDDHRAVLRTLVEDFYQQFLDVVREARPDIPPQRFAQVTDGRILSGADALEAGLVDRLGDVYDAFDLAKEMAGSRRADLVVYHRPLEYVGSPFAIAPGLVPGASGIQTQVNLAQFNFPESLAGTSVGLYYLWQPGGP